MTVTIFSLSMGRIHVGAQHLQHARVLFIPWLHVSTLDASCTCRQVELMGAGANCLQLNVLYERLLE